MHKRELSVHDLLRRAEEREPREKASLFKSSEDAVTVDMVEPLGAETLLHVRLENNPLTLRLPGKQPFTGDEKIRLAACRDDAWHLFETRSGVRIETSLGN